jgi:hypothetical protein
MTKQHQADAKLLASVKTLLRGANHENTKHAQHVTGSASLFELADRLHLGRARTRKLLQTMKTDLNRIHATQAPHMEGAL